MLQATIKSKIPTKLETKHPLGYRIPNEAEDVILLMNDKKLERLHKSGPILDYKQQHGNTGNGKDKLSYTTTTLITTTDKHGVPPTKRLFRVAMLDPSQGFIDPWGKFGDLELPCVVRSSKVVCDRWTIHFEILKFGPVGLRSSTVRMEIL
ncbi:hypothetical protein Tco_1183025 [Tanacetum coccineum]